MFHLPVVTHCLNVLVFFFRQTMTRDVEYEGATKCDIQYLNASANAENGQSTRERLCNRFELPAVPLGVKIVLVEQCRIDIILGQKFRRDVRAACQEQAVHLLRRNFACARVENTNVRMLRKKLLKPFFVLRTHPDGEIWHYRICDLRMGM